MNTHNDKTSENKSQATANSLSKLQGNSESSAEFVDNRPGTIAQRKLQASIQNSRRVQQLKAYQEMADNSPKAKQPAQLQAIPKTNTPAPAQRVIENGATQLLEAPEGDELLQGKFGTIQREGGSIWERVLEHGQDVILNLLYTITPEALQEQLERLSADDQRKVLLKMQGALNANDRKLKKKLKISELLARLPEGSESGNGAANKSGSLTDQIDSAIASRRLVGSIGDTIIDARRVFYSSLVEIRNEVQDGEKLIERATNVQFAGKAIKVALKAAPISGLGAIGNSIHTVGMIMETYGMHLAKNGIQVMKKYAEDDDILNKHIKPGTKTAELNVAKEILKAAKGPLTLATTEIIAIFEKLSVIPRLIQDWNSDEEQEKISIKNDCDKMVKDIDTMVNNILMTITDQIHAGARKPKVSGGGVGMPEEIGGEDPTNSSPTYEHTAQVNEHPMDKGVVPADSYATPEDYKNLLDEIS